MINQHNQITPYRQGQNTQSSNMIKRPKVRSVNAVAGSSSAHGGGSSGQKRNGASSGGAGQHSGVYGIGGNQTTGNIDRMVQDNIQIFKGNSANRSGIEVSKIKEVMNTSAPICISSYMKGGNGGRPAGSKGASRRQASFNNSQGGKRNGTQGGQIGVNDLGIVAGQTMNLSRAQAAKENQANGFGRQSGLIGTAIQQSNSAINALDEAALNSSLGGGNSANPNSRSIQPMSQTNPRLQQYFAGFGSKNGANPQTSNNPNDNSNPQFTKQYNEEDGFMRGARIAEKIQEFYNTTGAPMSGTVANLASGSQPLTQVHKSGPQDRPIQSQGGARGSSGVASSKMVLVGDNASGMRLGTANGTHQGNSNQGNGTRPRATSAYGSHASRRNLGGHFGGGSKGNHTHQQQTLIQMGAHQKAIIGSMKERKMQMRNINTKQNNYVVSGNEMAAANSGLNGTMVGVGHGFGTARPVSRESRIRTVSHNVQAYRRGGTQNGQEIQKHGVNDLHSQAGRLGANSNQPVAAIHPHQKQVNNFFSFGSGSASNAHGPGSTKIASRAGSRKEGGHRQTINSMPSSKNSNILSKTTVGTVQNGGSSNQQTNSTKLQKFIPLNQTNYIESNNGSVTPQSKAGQPNASRLQNFLRASGQNAEVLKISDLVTNASQENNRLNQTTNGVASDNLNMTDTNLGGHLAASGQSSNVTNADIRQIKLNYLQLNKRSNNTTIASNQPGGKTSDQKQGEYVNGQNSNPLNAVASSDNAMIAKGHKALSPGVAPTSNNTNGNPASQNALVLAQTNKARPSTNSAVHRAGNKAMQYRRGDEGERALQGQVPEIQARVINPVANQVKPGTAQGTRQPVGAQIYDRHPLDKAQQYKSEGQPDQEVIEFCTANSSIENLDNYFIGKRIGQGAYAVVRLGLHKALNQKIAVKIYEKFKLLEPNRRKSVKREMKIMEKLDHQNIAKLYEAFESHKQVFLIMEYVNGGSLHGYLKMKPNRQMPELEAKFLWRQVVQAIYYCHQRNVTHRDIKLENILLDETKERVKLIDFGFSTCIPHERKVKIFCGTPSYMAPEIVSKIEYSGPPADIWALGVLLFALLCGKFPFRGQNDKELYTNICKQELQFPDHVSAPARCFLNKIFQKNPDRRLSAKEILRDQWCEISAQDYEVLSPSHSLGFAKQSDINSFESETRPNNGLSYTQKMPPGTAQGVRPKTMGQSTMIINPQHIEFARGAVNSQKDKRLTMFPEDIKKFVIDSNKEKAVKKEPSSRQRVAPNLTTSDPTNSNQATSWAFDEAHPMHQTQDRRRENAGNSGTYGTVSPPQNRTGKSQLPLGGVVTGDKIQMRANLSDLQLAQQNAPRSGTAAPGKRNTFNMEAYQAYYNTNEQQVLPQNGSPNTDGQPAQPPQSGREIRAGTTTVGAGTAGENGERGAAGQNIINNIMHINHSGANINITSVPNSQNNFFFNLTPANNQAQNGASSSTNANQTSKTAAEPQQAISPKNGNQLNFHGPRKVVPGSSAYGSAGAADSEAATLDKRNKKQVAYDGDVIAKLEKKGHSMQAIKSALNDPSSTIASEYKQMCEEKQAKR